ncbi:MAG: acyl-CoA desaturase [Bacteroidota bacterium]
MSEIIQFTQVEGLPRIRYASPPTPFYKELRKRIHAHFEENDLSRYADIRMYGKTVFLLSLWVLLFALILSNQFQGIALIGLQVVWHSVMFLMTVGIAHDASHGAYSSKPWVNRLWNNVFDIVGINSYIWEFNHVKSHHNAPNIPIYDSAIDSFVLFRFHPRSVYKSFHRYQHIYIWGIYAMATMFKLFFLDFFSFRRKRIGFVNVEGHPTSEILRLIFIRSFVILYTLILPLVYLDAPTWQILTGFVIGHMISGLALGVIFQTTHLSNRTEWPEPNGEGVIENSFDQHILATTADYCPTSRVITWISGGLNLHVIHHLFPGYCQIHLLEMTRILREVAEEYGVNYHVYERLPDAVRSHTQTLKMLGDPDHLPQMPAAFTIPAVS